MPAKNSDKRRQTREGNRKLLIRTIVLMSVFGVAAFIPLFIQLFNISVRDHEKYENLAIEQQTSDTSVDATRGSIYDANGDVLAVSATVYNLILSPRDVIASVDENDYETTEEYQAAVQEKQQEIIDAICENVEGTDRDSVSEAMSNEDSAYQIIIKGLTDEQCEGIRNYISENDLGNCLYLVTDSKRYYPQGTLAAQVIGFTNSEGGAYGLELEYDSVLSGTEGRIVTSKNAIGEGLEDNYSDYTEAQNGNNIYTTIDSTIQAYCEEYLQEGIEKYDVQEGGCCIIMNCKTGAILGMASSPTFDPNDPSTVTDPILLSELDGLEEGSDEYNTTLAELQYTQWKNKALNVTIEPGSAFKAIVLSEVLQEGLTSEDEVFYCSGSLTINGVQVNCSNTAGHGSETLVEGLMNSCNPVFMTLGLRLGAEKFYDYFTDYGLTSYTNIDLPGEELGSVWSEEYLASEEGQLSLAIASFGQRFTVTPIQMITAFNAAINGGYLLQPYVVSKITDSNGTVIQETSTNVIRQVVSKETSERVAWACSQVAEDGTGYEAYVPGYKIAGKTSTTEKLNSDNVICMYITFAPYDDPEIICIMLFDSPKPSAENSSVTEDGYYIGGGNMAGTMSSLLLPKVLDYLGYEREFSSEDIENAQKTMQDYTGWDLVSAEDSLNEMKINYTIKGDGDTVTATIPSAGTELLTGSEVVLYCGEEPDTSQVTVPDLTGMTVSQIQKALNKLNLYFTVEGADEYTSSTYSTGQSIEAGTTVDRGTSLTVYFS